ncbi:MAG: type II secretion system inner membrane protein GspF [Pseudomonadales bacterium]|nr:type II secretion system inner membrane protein GspF [Pseudomonadales bacterium]
MPAFDYSVLDERGRQKKGSLEGDSARQVRQQLREKGLVPLTVELTVQNGKGATAQGPSLFGPRFNLSAADLSLITRQLSTLIQAGLPVEEALRAISKQSEKPKVKSMMLAVRSKVVEGHNLAQALNEFPSAFPHLYRATVAAGEHSGHLDLVLEQLADYTERSHDTSRKIKGAMVYPVVLTSFSILIVVGLMQYIVPKMASVFENSGNELPALTRGLIATSDFVGNYGLYVLVLLALAIFGFSKALQNETFKEKFHRQVLYMPLIGRISRGFNTSRVASTLSILSSSGVQLVEALKIAGEVAGNVCIREAVIEASVKVREGSSLNKSLDQSGYFPPMMIQMIASGEVSGELDTMLFRAASTQERELEALINTLVGLFQPLMMVLMGVVVMTIVLAVMLPIISLNTLIG